jgi:aspartyl-tRNA(Asn)/glutamyl-tRNA(Gln) amidotransferase subunit A
LKYNPAPLTFTETKDRFISGELAPKELELSQRKIIGRLNKELRAFISVLESGRQRGRGPLRGITIAVKDNVFVGGRRTTAGSKVFRNFVPTYDADVVTILRDAGATMIGKTNLHEFAFGVTNVNPFSGDCRNPWRRDRVSGGSSGGSAVAVATGMACAAIGTDTGGSVRIPASLCGVVGYKPTYGLISRRGVVPLAWSLDTVGFLTRSVADAATLAHLAFQGRPQATPKLGNLKPTRMKGLRLGVPWNLLEPLEDDVRRKFRESLAIAAGAGARVVPIKLNHVREASACRSLITHAEAASFHRQYFSARYRDYGRDMKRRIAQGLAIPAALYLDALRARSSLLSSFRSLFDRVDLLALPTTRIAAPTVKESKAVETAQNVRAALIALPEPFNLFGAPAISIPCGLTRNNLPVGFQLGADINCDADLLSAALALEQLLPRLPAPV